MKKNLTLLAVLAMALPMAWSQNSIFLAPVKDATTVTAPSTFGGESKGSKHLGWTTLESVSFGFVNTAPEANLRAGAGVGKASAKTFTITKTLDGSSTYFMTQAVTGISIPNMCIDMVKNTGTANAGKPGNMSFQNMIFSDVRITGYTQNAGTDNVPTEEITFSYAKVEINYIQTDAKTGASAPANTKKFIWDLVRNVTN